ncbi:hypothetical protein D3C77_695360 [compost metagenome]
MQGLEGRGLGQRTEQAEDQAQRQGGQGELDGHQRAGQQRGAESVEVEDHEEKLA